MPVNDSMVLAEICSLKVLKVSGVRKSGGISSNVTSGTMDAGKTDTSNGKSSTKSRAIPCIGYSVIFSKAAIHRNNISTLSSHPQLMEIGDRRGKCTPELRRGN